MPLVGIMKSKNSRLIFTSLVLDGASLGVKAPVDVSSLSCPPPPASVRQAEHPAQNSTDKLSTVMLD